jgi:uncharacterized MAPEG superfamily protein
MIDQHNVAGAASIEAISVVFAAVLVWLSALAQHVSNVLARGPQYVISDRSVSPSLEGFFGRATRTLANNIESTLMWVPPAIVILISHHTSSISQLVAETYIGTRTIYVLAYWLKIPVIRSLAWFVGMVCCGAAAVLAIVPVS